MKKCFKCHTEKTLSEYYKHKEMKDGHLNKCKECTKKDSRENEKNNSASLESYDKTEKGVIRVIYKTQKSSSKARKMPMPGYTKEELKDWLYLNGFKMIYNNWVNSKYDKRLKPSVDRIDDFKPYTLDNITLGTWQNNMNHQREDILSGKGTSGQRCKPVLCYKDGELLAEYVSFSSARRVVGYSMERSLRSGKPDKKNGFVWKYKCKN